MPYKVSAINPAKTALIIVDMENDFVVEGAPLRAKMALAVVPPLQRALAHARQTGTRVIYTTHAHRRDGCDMGVYGSLWPPHEVVLKKRRYSAFYGTTDPCGWSRPDRMLSRKARGVAPLPL